MGEETHSAKTYFSFGLGQNSTSTVDDDDDDDDDILFMLSNIIKYMQCTVL